MRTFTLLLLPLIAVACRRVEDQNQPRHEKTTTTTTERPLDTYDSSERKDPTRTTMSTDTTGPGSPADTTGTTTTARPDPWANTRPGATTADTTGTRDSAPPTAGGVTAPTETGSAAPTETGTTASTETGSAAVDTTGTTHPTASTQGVSVRADCSQTDEALPQGQSADVGKASVLVTDGTTQHLTAIDSDSNCRINVIAPQGVDTVAIGRALLDALPPRG